MPLRAAIYVRVSSERQADPDKVSVESQLADCHDLARRQGYAVVGAYVDRERYRVRGRLVPPSASVEPTE